MTPSYVVISPVRNEGSRLPRTIESMLRQTCKPKKWIVVDDNSTDDSAVLVETAAANHPWIQCVRRKESGVHRTGGKVIRVFNDGYSLIANSDWDFIVKLDCDLEFESNYFETILDRFRADDRLGIASGVYLEEQQGEWREIEMPSYHACGASKIVRRQCFEQIDGFVTAAGWDTVDEIRAMAKGWRTTHFPDLRMKHLKPEGSGMGSMRTNVMLGEIYYKTGGSLPFFLAKLIRRASSAPVLTGALAMAWGYTKAAARFDKRLVSKSEGKLYKRLLNRRLLNEVGSLFCFRQTN